LKIANITPEGMTVISMMSFIITRTYGFYLKTIARHI